MSLFLVSVFRFVFLLLLFIVLIVSKGADRMIVTSGAGGLDVNDHM